MQKLRHFIFISILLIATLACNAILPQTIPASPAPTVDLPQPSTVSPTTTSAIPWTEADVPRISVSDAKAAFESGQAVIVDVRSPDAYAEGHVTGAINIPLGNFESNIANIPLKKDQWIITYCT
ncbi:MAG: rhodanese-like domain-containing protein [Chloroflexi bacterium]|nr:rhodanese-like domain-containing protein [Chloroflexota bacterium]